MTTLHLLALTLLGALPARTRDDRGDVPGWVLVTVVTGTRRLVAASRVGPWS